VGVGGWVGGAVCRWVGGCGWVGGWVACVGCDRGGWKVG
jgi:hypothetical protein